MLTKEIIDENRDVAENVEWDFAAAEGQTINEKVKGLIAMINMMPHSYLVANPTTLCLFPKPIVQEFTSGLEPQLNNVGTVSGHLADTWSDGLYPLNEILLITNQLTGGDDKNKTISIKNFM